MDRTRRNRPKRSSVLSGLAGLGLALLVCANVQSAPSPAGTPQAVKASEPAPVAQDYRYDARGKTDPFKPFVRLEVPVAGKKPAKKSLSGPLTPLQRVPLDKLRLTGIAGSSIKRVGMVEEGGRGYMVTVGTPIGLNGGRVIQILPDQLVVEEKFEREDGKERTHRVALKLHREEGEGKP